MFPTSDPTLGRPADISNIRRVSRFLIGSLQDATGRARLRADLSRSAPEIQTFNWMSSGYDPTSKSRTRFAEDGNRHSGLQPDPPIYDPISGPAIGYFGIANRHRDFQSDISSSDRMSGNWKASFP